MATLSSDAFDREALRVVVAGVLWNAANYPLRAQRYLLGTDTAPLTAKVVDAVIAHLSEHDRQVKAGAWDEGYWRGINGHTGPSNPHRDSGQTASVTNTSIEQAGVE